MQLTLQIERPTVIGFHCCCVPAMHLFVYLYIMYCTCSTVIAKVQKINKYKVEIFVNVKYLTTYSWVSLCKYTVNLSGGQPQLY